MCSLRIHFFVTVKYKVMMIMIILVVIIVMDHCMSHSVVTYKDAYHNVLAA